jgi:quinolinate synthase
MVSAAQRTRCRTVLVATEVGILHQLRKANPAATFEPVSADAVCRYMKMITPAKLLASLREGVHEVRVDEDVRRRAERAVRQMIAIGRPGGGE